MSQKKPFFAPKMTFLGDYGKKWRRLIMLKINFFVCHMTFNWPSRAFKLVHQPFYVPKQPFLGQKWCFKAIMTKVKKVNFSFDIHLGIGVQVTIRKNVIDGIDVANPSKCNYSHHSSALDWPWCLACRLEFREFTKQVLSAPSGTWPGYCVDFCTGAGLYWHG